MVSMQHLPDGIIDGIIDSIIMQSRDLSEAVHDIDTMFCQTWSAVRRSAEGIWPYLLVKALEENDCHRKTAEALKDTLSVRQLVFLVVGSRCQRCGGPDGKIYTQFGFRVCDVCYRHITVSTWQMEHAGVKDAAKDFSSYPSDGDRFLKVFLRCHVRNSGKLPEVLCCKVAAPTAQQRRALVQMIGGYSEEHLHQHSRTFSEWAKGFSSATEDVVATIRREVFKHEVFQRVREIFEQTYKDDCAEIWVNHVVSYSYAAKSFFGDDKLPEQADIVRMVNELRVEQFCEYWNKMSANCFDSVMMNRCFGGTIRFEDTVQKTTIPDLRAFFDNVDTATTEDYQKAQSVVFRQVQWIMQVLEHERHAF